MKIRHIIIFFLFAFLIFSYNSAPAQQAYQVPPLEEIALGSIRPTGWLRDQLVIMRNGSTGHLDEVHDKIKKENGWLGGAGDGWEETPYWLDGAVPLAYLLNDAQLKQKVLRYINWTLDHQRPSGYFGPLTKDERDNGVPITPSNCASGEDWWPKMIMLKVLQQYYTATGDQRVIPFMTRFFDYQLASIKACPLGKWTEWATSRGTDNVMMVQWLYSKTKNPKLLELASVIDEQSFAWSTWLGNRDWVMWAAANQTDEFWMRRHAVNIGMALKAPVINFQRTGDQTYLDAIKTGWDDLMMLHGLPMGIFSGDEDLHGNDPTQGVELCAIVESMFSLEKIIELTGDIKYMDALERMAYNALPTQTTDDYNAKQYFQIANQVQVSRGVFDFSLPFDRGMNNVFGLRSGYTCCTSNMHQGWTKFASHLWYKTPDAGLAAIEYAPCEIRTVVGKESTPVVINEKTNYPFQDEITFEIGLKDKTDFPMVLRIPAWCSEGEILINGKLVKKEKGGKLITLNRQWTNGDIVLLKLPMEVRTSSWAKNSRAIERGPLVFALKIGERWEKDNEKTEGDYYCVFPTSEWNFGLLEEAIKNPSAHFEVRLLPMPPKFIWNQKNSPVEIVGRGKKIPSWQVIDGVAHQPVTDRNGIYKGKVEEVSAVITLIPYGCTKVRVVAFPVVK